MYRLLFRTLAVRVDPERAHLLALGLIRTVSRVPVLSDAVRATLGRRPDVPVPAAADGGPLARPVPGVLGLAAGMDKDADTVLGMDMIGFGFVEVGTVTARPQPGNERPRLWRHVELGALRNRMGFNNRGATAAGEQLRRLRRSRRGRSVVVGANIGKSKVTPLDGAVADYETSAREVARWADYLVVNVSSPNTPGLRDLQAVDSLRPILAAVRRAADESAGRAVPLFVKIAPDLSDDDVDAVADLALELGLAGVVATNTTVNHDLGPGGLSGSPLRERSLAVVSRLRGRLGERGTIIGVGGISTEADARAMIAAGADLLQAYSAFVYEGPAWPGRINRALGRR
ncbi:dihydroorotate oxidase A [Georgenia soli]|uniref:Dihydroorotate dehydrogenase (quinone) n=1 Tax=Georgenia soli TaxID=638953 RepID=A0A2A9EHX3_9MICO|nr:quinone-dependent dihydroorotate dehydrogenase [Georgenia soli]PFG37855.1 dihydroorotate oxidase A [Georgenia soli]PFG41360.1 dihydroorotate oxidase A [Georgenia soli]PFG41364.1 dihydroorotate oxidase A [Georgenia soli]